MIEPTFDMAALAKAAWDTLTDFSEVRYVHNDSFSPYKPFYRLATILTYRDPPHFKQYGSRRHLTEDEAVEVVRQAHPYLAEKIDEPGGRDHFLHLFNEFKEDSDPETDWLPLP